MRRFKVRKRDAKKFYSVNIKLMRNQAVSLQEEKVYVEEMINSPDLYRYMTEHKDEYQLFVFIPYMFGTTFYGCQVCPEKSILIPCLHNESYAYMQCFKKVFPAVKGMIFNSDPEKNLAQKIYGVQGEFFLNLGEGLDTEFVGDERAFRKKYKIVHHVCGAQGRGKKRGPAGLVFCGIQAKKSFRPKIGADWGRKD